MSQGAILFSCASPIGFNNDILSKSFPASTPLRISLSKIRVSNWETLSWLASRRVPLHPDLESPTAPPLVTGGTVAKSLPQQTPMTLFHASFSTSLSTQNNQSHGVEIHSMRKGHCKLHHAWKTLMTQRGVSSNVPEHSQDPDDCPLNDFWTVSHHAKRTFTFSSLCKWMWRLTSKLRWITFITWHFRFSHSVPKQDGREKVHVMSQAMIWKTCRFGTINQPNTSHRKATANKRMFSFPPISVE